MPLSLDRSRAASLRPRLAVAALIVAGFGLTLTIFYPGVMTYDAKFIYEDIAKGFLGDWQSPVMTVLWGAIDPDRARRGQPFSAYRNRLLAGIRVFGVCAGTSFDRACAHAAAACAGSPCIHPGRHSLAGRAFCHLLAARRLDRLRLRWI